MKFLSLTALFLLALPAAARADEPQASFSIADGLLRILVTKDGTKPMPCKLAILLPNGNPWGDGETDEDGLVVVPKPNADGCILLFDHGGAAMAPVELKFLDDGKSVIPLVVPLTPGPCCTTAPKYRFGWLEGIGVGVALLIPACVVIRELRQLRRPNPSVGS